jgi:hypothetical protein
VEPRTPTDFRFNYPIGEGGSSHVDVRTTDNGALAYSVLTLECGGDLSDKAADVVPFDQGDVNHSECVFDFECEEPSKLADDLMDVYFSATIIRRARKIGPSCGIS